MKKKILLIFIFILLITIFSLTSIKAKQNYEISNDFKDTEYKILNKEINENLNKFIGEFKNSIYDNLNYYLNITHETSEYKNYLSYVFFIEYYTGGAHPNHKIWTVIYDKNNNTIVDINTLIEKNPNILNKVSRIIRNRLLYNKNIVDTNMMLEGTKPIKENFSNFAFSKDGIIIFFEYYQVAPYSSGEFKVIIPYDSIIL